MKRMHLMTLGLTVVTTTLCISGCRELREAIRPYPNRRPQASDRGPQTLRPMFLKRGVYTIQQKSSGRFVDAHEYAGKDYALVTRAPASDRTQEWFFYPEGDLVYTIQQMSSHRYVDAHEHAGKDYSVVTRPKQNNDTQRWIVRPVGTDTFTIQQKSSGRFVDAHEYAGKDFGVVTRPPQNNDTQRWIIRPR